jgi:mono/diheme cytochrome c family protein
MIAIERMTTPFRIWRHLQEFITAKAPSVVRAGCGPAQSGMLLLVLLACQPAIAAEGKLPPPGECPQPRFTGKAPAEFLARTNPLTASPETLAAGESIYNGKSKSVPCAMCHGVNGDGKGPLASQYIPRPRNFACKATVNGIEDGQLFWIVRYGSPGTAMPPSADLSDDQVWQVVTYLRQLATR